MKIRIKVGDHIMGNGSWVEITKLHYVSNTEFDVVGHRVSDKAHLHHMMKLAIREATPKPELATEYIDEAEHGDGKAYWNLFDTVEEAVDDFKLYLDNLE